MKHSITKNSRLFRNDLKRSHTIIEMYIFGDLNFEKLEANCLNLGSKSLPKFAKVSQKVPPLGR